MKRLRFSLQVCVLALSGFVGGFVANMWLPHANAASDVLNVREINVEKINVRDSKGRVGIWMSVFPRTEVEREGRTCYMGGPSIGLQVHDEEDSTKANIDIGLYGDLSVDTPKPMLKLVGPKGFAALAPDSLTVGSLLGSGSGSGAVLGSVSLMENEDAITTSAGSLTLFDKDGKVKIRLP